ncbi:MAG: hypothetical protein HY320_14360 [Armatimonadetes bacterium]|nr:hypothetical protein [Armatimonadota bacterium]
MSVFRRMSRSGVPLLFTALVLAATQAAMAQTGERETIPADTVVRLKMDSALNSRDAKEGDLFASVLAESDRSGFPEGTRFQGVVREVQRHTDNKPGMLDVEIHRAYLPGGGKVAVSGRLASLAGDDVRRMENGRLEARKRSGSKMDWKWAGYGAGAGAVLSAVTGGKILKGVLLGGLAGAVYGYFTRDKGEKDSFRDVDLPRGTEFGMRLERQVVFDNRASYRYASDQQPPQGSREDERILGERQEMRYQEATVRLDGRSVQLDEPPMNLNGILYVPLEPIARAANLRLTHRPGQHSFALSTAAGRMTASAGETRVTMSRGEAVTLTEEPVSLNGMIFVSPDYLSRVANLRAYWDAANLRLELQTQR